MRSRVMCAVCVVGLGLLLGARAAVAGPPFAYAVRGSSEASTPSSGPTYHGGPVISHAQVVVVFWGPNVYSTVKTTMGTFVSALTDNEFVDWLDEYYSDTEKFDPIGRGSWGGTYTITPNNQSQQLTDTAVANELGYQIQHGSLPQPNANSIYMIYFAPNYTITTPPGVCGVSCQPGGFCGCHEYTTQTVNTSTGATATFAYGMIPDLSSGGCVNSCAAGTVVQDAEVVTSHEVAEAITDPYGTGWYPEIGDPCAGNETTITSYNGQTFSAQYLWSRTSNGCIAGRPKCQTDSQTFGESSSSTGFAPSEVQSWWTANHCTTAPAGNVSQCQNMSDMYGISPSVSGYAPSSVLSWYAGLRCATSPAVSESLCQRISDTYATTANVTWGAAPSYVRTFWQANSCSTAARGIHGCQRAADLYGIVPGSTWGFAPSDIQNDFSAQGCTSSTMSSAAQLCQNISDLYGTVANVTWGIAPSTAQSWWISNGCSTTPVCQHVSDLVGISPGNIAMANSAQVSWFQTAACSTEPQYVVDPCQVASDVFGAAAFSSSYDPGFLPNMPAWDSQIWWSTNCFAGTYHPRSDTLRQYTPGP